MAASVDFLRGGRRSEERERDARRDGGSRLVEGRLARLRGVLARESDPPPDDLVRSRRRSGRSVRFLPRFGFDLPPRVIHHSSFIPNSAARLVNAENDFLPGVVADIYDGFVVLQLTSAFAEAHRETIVSALLAAEGVKGVSERRDIDSRRKEGLAVDEELHVLAGAEPPELIEIAENDIRYFVDVRKGHKTGFYLDQREARALVGSLAAGRNVLNCFSYTGGFGLAAAAGGAASVTQVDVSSDALALARRNEGLTFNHSSFITHHSSFSYVEADVFQYLRKCRDAGKKFDMIVLDPPKFAESKAQVMKAARGYKDINLLAMKLLAPGGILATFSCSGAMTTELFDKILAEAAVDAKRDFQMIARTRQAADHPVALAFPEGLYLKGVILRSV